MPSYNPTFTPEEQQNEIWKPIPYFENIYSISTLGRIRRNIASDKKPIGYMLKINVGKWGYPYVGLYRDHKVHTFIVHRLLMRTFAGQPPPKYEVNHKNGIKTDNRLENLEYVTRGENIAHAIRTGLNKAPYCDPKYRNNTRKPRLHKNEIREIRAARGLESAGCLAERFGVHKGTINRIQLYQVYKHI
jgi:hypothetical protein